MSVFEYLIALVSVVIGLAVAHTLGGILRLVHHRETVRFDWLPLLWTGTLLLWTVFFWWFTFGMVDAATEWRPRNFLFVLGYSGAIYFVLGVLYPDDIGPGFDMRGHFEKIHRWFFGSLMVLAAFDVVDTVYKIATRVHIPSPVYAVVLGTLVVGSAVGWRVKHRRYHAVFAVVFAVLVVAYVMVFEEEVGSPGLTGLP